jgi:hypothetical protein
MSCKRPQRHQEEQAAEKKLKVSQSQVYIPFMYGFNIDPELLGIYETRCAALEHIILYCQENEASLETEWKVFETKVEKDYDSYFGVVVQKTEEHVELKTVEKLKGKEKISHLMKKIVKERKKDYRDMFDPQNPKDSENEDDEEQDFLNNVIAKAFKIVKKEIRSHVCTY